MLPDNVTQALERLTGLAPPAQQRMLLSVAVLLALWLLRRFTLHLVHRRSESLKARYQARKLSAWLGSLVALLVVGWIWLPGFTGMATYLGLLSAGVAIALKEPLVNLVGWGFILLRRPFEVGDRIQIGKHAGDVIDLRIFQFSLLEIGNWVDADQSTGRVIHIPNGQVFINAVANYTRGFNFIWNELPVLVTFESNWRAAKEILTAIVQETTESLSEQAQQEVRNASRRFMIFYSKLTPTVYTSVEDSGVLLTIRYLCEPRRRRGSAQTIWEAILTRFAERDDIDFAYPTQRFYRNDREGKPELKPSGEPPHE
ncbi:MAG: mechanosensitive ion channel family protein [Thermoanaerobaculia bacterium]|nr:mechanosensitive ion channel family protein [Thermoanaerobaculia bacterium]